MAQALSGLVALRGLTMKEPKLLAQTLRLEFLVTAIQFSFYAAFLRNVRLADMAKTRYADWFLTTPMMLVSMASYFLYKKGENSSIGDLIRKYKSQFVRILLTNLVMLVAGYLGEIGYISKMSAVVAGTVALIMTFRIIYKEMGGADSKKIFKLMSAVWGLYGVAYVLPDTEKNVMYNMLDLVSKNFFAIFLTRELEQFR
jgi:bacteriorhodopsin